jgi:hypothetical protein
MSQDDHQGWKEMVLTLLIVMPFICLLGIAHIGKGEIFVVYGVELFAYLMARIIFKQKTGRWKW